VLHITKNGYELEQRKLIFIINKNNLSTVLFVCWRI